MNESSELNQHSAYPGQQPASMTYQEFLRKNPAVGYLKIQASRAESAIPTSGVDIYVYQIFSDLRVLFYHGITDENGIIDPFELPAPPKALTLDPEASGWGAVYQVLAYHVAYEPELYEAEIFDGITSILPVNLNLKKE